MRIVRLAYLLSTLVVVSAVASPVQASSVPAFPTFTATEGGTFGDLADATDWDSASGTNQNFAQFTVGGVSGGVEVISIALKGFNTGLSNQNLAFGGAGISPASITPYVWSQSGNVQIQVWFDDPSVGQLDGVNVGMSGTDAYIDFEVQNSGSGFSGVMGFRILSGQLTGDGTSSAREIEFVGIVGGFNQVALNSLSWSSGGSGPNPAPTNQVDQSTPAKYAGPEFSGLSAKGIMAGTSPRLEGKNLDEISSIEIGGKAATFTLDGNTALDLTLPEGLAPGLYDLVIHSGAGKLTHINAIQVREPRRAFSVTTRSEDRITETQYYEHSLIASMQIPELNKVRCIVNGPNLAQARAQAERLCALVAAANPDIETTVIEPRSTVKNNSVFARVTYGWN